MSASVNFLPGGNPASENDAALGASFWPVSCWRS